MNEPAEMSAEELDKWMQQNGASLKIQAERSAQSYSARRQAIELANKEPSSPISRNELPES